VLRDPRHSVAEQVESKAMAGRMQLGRAHDVLQDPVLLIGWDVREPDFLLRLDLDAEDLLLLVPADPAAEQHSASMRARVNRSL